MKNTTKRFLTFLSFLALGIGTISGCSKQVPNEITKPDQNIENPEVPNTPVIPEEKDPIINQEIVPTTGFIKGAENKKNLTKEQAYNDNGGLLVPFDTAFPEYMNKAVYDQNSILVKCENRHILSIVDKLKNLGVVDYDFVSNVNKTTSWYKLVLNGISSKDAINLFRETNTEALTFDLNYVLDKTNLYTIEETVAQEKAIQEGTTVDNCFIDGAELNQFFINQYYFKLFGLKKAYEYIKTNNLPKGGEGTIAAVIDTGVDMTHPDLKENIYTNLKEIPGNHVDDDQNGYVDDIHGWNFVDNNNDPTDDQGHGTHVAGIIGAKNNRIGVVGIAYNTKIMPLKAGDCSGFFTHERITKAINYAYLNGADVINMSFGGSTISLAMQDALENAYTKSVLVAAAGNDGLPNELFQGCRLNILPSYPAALTYVIGVMSCNNFYKESNFTNFDGEENTDIEYEIYAPGENVYSTIPGGKYCALSGTSMAAPIVSGIACLLRTRYISADFSSKLIHGQIIGATKTIVSCGNEELHGKHNIPMAVNAFDSLTKEPKPDVSITKFFVFDSKEFSSLNNGNGSIDAGETIYIAPVLFNKWGMSADTVVTFDVKSDISQQDSKYVTLENKVISFDRIGTLTQKHFLTYNNEHTSIIGCDLTKSLKMIVKQDCPNDINISLNYNIEFKNGLNVNDNIQYSTERATKYLDIINEIVLPNIIDKDLTLGNEHIYVIDGPTYVVKGATLSIKEGTQIIFGRRREYGVTNYDSYIDNKGTINFIGKKDSLINIKNLDNAFFCCIYNHALLSAEFVHFTNFNLSDGNFNHCIFDYTTLGSSQRGFSDGCQKTYVKNSVFNVSLKDYLFRIFDGKYERVVFNLLSLHSEIILNYNRVIFNHCTFINHTEVPGKTTFDVEADFKNYKLKYLSNIKAYDQYLQLDLQSNLTKEDAIFVLKHFSDNGIITLNPFEYEKTKCSINSSNYTDISIYIKNNEAYMFNGEKIDLSLYPDGPVKNEINEAIRYYNDKIVSLTYSFDSITKELKSIDSRVYKIISFYYIVDDPNLAEYNDYIWSLDNYECCLRNSYNNFLFDDFDDFKITVNNYNDAARPKIDNVIVANGLTNQQINDAVFDGNDSPYKPILGIASETDPELETLWPYVTKCELTDSNGQPKHTFGKELINVKLTLNREMNTEVPLNVKFGSVKPYADYVIEGNYTSTKTWEGTFFVNTLIENGEQYINIKGGEALTDSFMYVIEAPRRFKFNIDTTIAMAQIISGTPQDDGILLNWSQDEYSNETIMGYNIYKSNTKDGNYTKINKTIISKDEHNYLDTEVAPGETYWYTFTIVLSSFEETAPVGKASIKAKDTMSPNITHTPVYQWYTGSPLTITCKASDNIGMQEVVLYYRNVGDTEYKQITMGNVNNIYSATIPSSELTTAGIEYYIEGTDGFNYSTPLSCSKDAPYQIIIKDGSLISQKGDVNGDGEITIVDAHMILNHIYGEILLTDEQFIRADLNGDKNLTTDEALRILQYINGNVTDLVM